MAYPSTLFKKVDAETGLPLAGAKFHITSDNNETNFTTGATNYKGLVRVTVIEEGTYYYEEVQTPDDEYEPIKGKIPFQVPLNELVIKNHKKGPLKPYDGYTHYIQFYNKKRKREESILYDTFRDNLGYGCVNIKPPYRVYYDDVIEREEKDPEGREYMLVDDMYNILTDDPPILSLIKKHGQDGGVYVPPVVSPTNHWVQYRDVIYKQHIVYQCDNIETSGSGVKIISPFIKWVDGKKTHEELKANTQVDHWLPEFVDDPSSDMTEVNEVLKKKVNVNAFNMYLRKINDLCVDYVKTYGLESLLDCLVITKRKLWGEMLGFDCLAFRGTPDTDITYDSIGKVTENITEFYCGGFKVTNVKGLFSFDYTDLSSRTSPTSKNYENVRDGFNSTEQTPNGSWFCWQGKFELITGFVGRRNLDKPLDRLISVFEYHIPSLAYEPAIEPNRCGDLQETEIALLKCPELSPACNDTYMFAGPQIQYQYYMQKKQPLKYNNYSYVRRDNTVNIEEHVDNIRGYNYCVYKNKGKYFYAFIMKKEYVNERTTRLYLAIDVIQTFLFDFELEDSMVDRCHVDRWQRSAPNQPTREIEPEGLEFGENKEWGKNDTRYKVAEYKSTYVAVCSNPLGWLPSRHKSLPKPEEGGGEKE